MDHSRRRCLAVAVAVVVVVVPTLAARADNSPEKAESNARSEYVAKVEEACDLSLSFSYDGTSLRAHDEYIRRDQTDGARECNEPLRYLWYACQTPAGKTAAKNAGIRTIVCKGTRARANTLELASGTLTLARAADDDDYARLRKRFESLLRVAVQLGKAAEHPDHDAAWNELRYAPNPTRSTTDYCLVNGKKQEYEAQLPHRFRGEDATLQCWKAGQKVTDLRFRAGQKTGFYTQFGGSSDVVFSYRDDALDGDRKDYRDGKLVQIVHYARGDVRWSKEFHPNGKVKHYSRRLASGYAGYRQGEDGRIYSLDCAPDVCEDVLLRELCGFEGELTVRIYDGTEKINRIETWKNGVLQKQSAGDSDYAERSTANYVAGKKHGIERVVGPDGKLAASVSWKNGVKDGPETAYAEGGTKRTRETLWASGARTQVTEFYLNGNPKQRERYSGDERKQVTVYWDTGKIRRLGEMVRCARDWCEQGAHRTYFEHGKAESEANYERGRLAGAFRSWWPNGRQAVQEEYVDGRRVKSTRWDESGKLVAHERYEADGSRILGR